MRSVKMTMLFMSCSDVSMPIDDRAAWDTARPQGVGDMTTDVGGGRQRGRNKERRGSDVGTGTTVRHRPLPTPSPLAPPHAERVFRRVHGEAVFGYLEHVGVY